MAYTDDEKRNFCVGVIVKYLNSLNTWDKFKTFVNEVTKEKLKTKLKEAYQLAQTQDDTAIILIEEKRANDGIMLSEIDSL